MRSAFAALLAAILFLIIALRMGGTVGPATPDPEAVVAAPPGLDTTVPPGTRTGSGRKEQGKVTARTESRRSEATGEDPAPVGPAGGHVRHSYSRHPPRRGRDRRPCGSRSPGP